MESFSFADVQTDIDLDVTTPILQWQGRRQEYDRVKRSKELYDNMDMDEREAVKARLKRSIQIMYDNIDEWMPTSLSLKEEDIGTMLVINYNIILTDIMADVAEASRVTSFTLNEASKELISIIAELDET